MDVKNLEEAMNFFLENSTGSVICIKEGKESVEVNSYPDAKKFYGED